MWSTVGQDHLLRQLSSSLSAGRIGHAYLLVGPPHVGKSTLAYDLASAVNCHNLDRESGPCGTCIACDRIHRDVFADISLVAVGGDPQVPTRISIRQVREMENFLSITPVEGGWKVVIVDGAETLAAGQGESANALLKTLEEPPERVLLLLLTTAEDAILPTIRSRCRVLHFRPMSGDVLATYLVSTHDRESEEAARLARLARGCPGWAINAIADPTVLESRNDELGHVIDSLAAPMDQRFSYADSLAGSFSRNRQAVRDTLFLWQSWWRDLLMAKEGVINHVQNIDRREELESLAESFTAAEIVLFLRRIQATISALDANANPRLALECMALEQPVIRTGTGVR